jgi:hypothetical protein
MATNLFEYATRTKLRFQTPKGLISTEDLWEVPLRSKDGFDLNTVAKAANEALKALKEENFVEKARTVAHTRAEVTFELVKHVIETKLDEEAAAKKRANNVAVKKQLIDALEQKQAGKLTALSESELRKRIEDLET